jgi:acetolactate decarboxylase
MREMFAKGDIGGNIPLAEFRNSPHLYAVAPLEGLRGEITAWDGKPYVSYVRDNAVVVEQKADAKAIFMVWAQVAEWSEVAVPETIKSYTELEQFVGEAAKSAGVDTNQPFPFLLKGTPQKVDWHVNNYVSDNTPLTQEKHDKAKFKGTLENEAVEIVGFYSDKHAGVFTHHTTKMHLHMRSVSGKAMGHLDDITLGGGIKLYLPKS